MIEFWAFTIIIVALALTVVIAILETIITAAWEAQNVELSDDEHDHIRHLGGVLYVWTRRTLRRLRK